MRGILVCLFLLFAMTACAGKPSLTVPSLPPAVPYQTLTPSLTYTVMPPVPGLPQPTPTTVIYIVMAGDTMNGIAGHFGLTLAALLSANPGVQPDALPVGTKLIIPTGNAIPGEPTPTPAPLPVQQARCWQESDGGRWCFALVKNEYAETLENISARFTLLDSNGKQVASQTAYALLDILPPGRSMPLAVHFPPAGLSDVSVQVEELTAIRLLPGDTRYLSAAAENTLVTVDASGLSAQASGRIVFTGSGTAKTLWLLATAYDAYGEVVGLRRWEASSPFPSDAPVQFDLLVSSVGPVIDRVEFLVEARP